MLISQNDIHRFELQGLIIHKQMVNCGWWNFFSTITGMVDFHGIKITDVLRNYYKLPDFHRLYKSYANRAFTVHSQADIWGLYF